MLSRPLASLLAAACIILSGTPIQAQSILYVDDDAPVGGDGLSWDSACCYLCDAIAIARANPGLFSEIRVAGGLYRPDRGNGLAPGDRTASFILLDGVPLKGGYAGRTAPSPDMRDLSAYPSILSGDLAGNDGPDFTGIQENSYSVVSTYAAATVVLDGFTITGGNADHPTTYRTGAGLRVGAANATVRNCIFRKNNAAGGGAGLSGSGCDTLSVTNCLFSGNNGAFGGAISVWGVRDCTILQCIMLNNSAQFGGAIFSDSGSNSPFDLDYSCRILNCTMVSNRASSGGGAIFTASQPGQIANNILWANAAPIAPQIAATMRTGGPDVRMPFLFNDIEGDQAGAVDLRWLDWGPGNINADPLFVAPGNFHLRPSSPCIDAGNSDLLPPGVSTDLDGRPRFFDDPAVPDTGVSTNGPVVDMGTYEFDLNADFDHDGIPGGTDNCPFTANPEQADEDTDSVGDACDACAHTLPGLAVDFEGCPPTVPGDFDRDGDVDQEDFGHFQICLTGDGVVQNEPACAIARIDADKDVDQADVELFRRCMTGSGNPGNPGCRG